MKMDEIEKRNFRLEEIASVQVCPVCQECHGYQISFAFSRLRCKGCNEYFRVDFADDDYRVYTFDKVSNIKDNTFESGIRYIGCSFKADDADSPYFTQWLFRAGYLSKGKQGTRKTFSVPCASLRDPEVILDTFLKALEFNAKIPIGRNQIAFPAIYRNGHDIGNEFLLSYLISKYIVKFEILGNLEIATRLKSIHNLIVTKVQF